MRGKRFGLRLPLAVCSVSLGLFVFGMGFLVAPGQGEERAVPLPGARAIVDAARHSSLQAAVDALSDEGGLVLLPPGTFEIHEPLILSKGDVTVDLLQSEPWDLFMVVFDETDPIQHYLWHFYDSGHPDHPPATGHALADAIPRVYRPADRP